MNRPTRQTHRLAGQTVSSNISRFDVFEHAGNRYEAVKCGFSWPAFFFTLFWAFIKRLWPQAILTLSFVLVLAIVPAFHELERQSFGNSGLGLILGLLFGFRGNVWRTARLEALGWTHASTVEADKPSQAIAIVRDKRTHTPSQT